MQNSFIVCIPNNVDLEPKASNRPPPIDQIGSELPESIRGLWGQ
jgi:hypothetical protein